MRTWGVSPTLLALRSASWVLWPLSWRSTITLGRLLGRFIYTCLPIRLKVMRRNLCCVAGALLTHDGLQAPNAIHALERDVYEHAGVSLMMALQSPRHRRRAADEVQSSGESTAALAADCEAGGVLICSAHVGAWELLPELLARHVSDRARKHGVLVYRPLHDAPLDRWVCERRTAAAQMAMLPSTDTGCMSVLRGALQQGGAVGLLADQRPADGHAAVEATFFGQPTCFSPGLAALHEATGAPIWFAVLLLIDGAAQSDPASSSLRLHLERLAPRAAPHADAGGCRPCVVQAYADALSSVVSSAPAQYFWFHDRWRPRMQPRAAAAGFVPPIGP